MKKFELNHEGESLADITGVSREVAETIIREKPYTDIGFAVGLLILMNKIENAGFLLSLILEPVLDKEFERPSNIVEYIVNKVQGDEQRKKMVDTIHEAIFPKKGEVKIEVIHADNLEDALNEIKRRVSDEQSGK